MFAALFVVAFHWVGGGENAWGKSPTELFHRAHPFAAYGWMGVHLFFLISGFVICMSAWGKPLGEFFVSRVARLYPAFWFAVLATSGVVALLPLHKQPLPVPQVALNLTMLAEPLNGPLVDGVYWTLWTELKFYLLFAIVVWRGVTYRRVILFCVLWAVASVLATASNSDLLLAIFTPQYSMFFVGGIAFYLMYRFGPNPLLWCIVGFSWLHTQYMLANQATIAGGQTGAPQYWWVSVPLVTLFYFAIAAVALGWLSWARWRWLTVAGALTYPLYLLHGVIGFTMIRWLYPAVPKWVLLSGLLTGMLLLSWLVHRYVERPVSTLLKRGLRRSIAAVRAASDESSPVEPPPVAAPPASPATGSPAPVSAVSPVELSPAEPAVVLVKPTGIPAQRAGLESVHAEPAHHA
ncbi:MAG: hypothetical protein AUI14_02520 [Actinobacteria bacterium 13_2_20CM_2_71_6]|nr:MAG: hypothetical protein AUI14_02520 [Actinobacteria bacterium 13_2_20CM_2_71_6]